MSREDEIAQGLREPGGALTFPLDAFAYARGYTEAEAGIAPAGLTSPSYDLGRALYVRRQEDAARFMDRKRAEAERRDRAMKEILPPVAYEEWRAKDAEIKAPWKSPPPIGA